MSTPEVPNPLDLFDGDDESLEACSVALPLAKDSDAAIPALREISARIINVDEKEGGAPAEDGGKTAVLLEDPEGLTTKAVVLSTWAYAVAALFNGKRNAREVSLAFEEKYGQPIEPAQALELQEELDKVLFLYSRRFEKMLKKQIQGYLDQEVRPATHAGAAYPDDIAALKATINGFFAAPDGPGALNLPTSDPSLLASNGGTGIILPKNDSVRALILPHIDLRVGGATYAHGYRELLYRSQAELFVVLGVAHQNPSDGLFNVSTKDYATPLGVLKTERAMARRLQEAAGVDPALAELAHRTEHSIEFQAVLLTELLGDRCKRDVRILPVLCGGVEGFLADEANPLEAPAFKRFVAALRKELDASKKKWCILCSVDMSHVGPEFGHSTMMDERMLPPVKRGDQRLLKCAEQLDPAGFYQEIVRTNNARHVDAVTAVLTMLSVCKGLLRSGRTLHYDQMLKQNSHSAVSYASLAFDAN